MAEPKKKRPLVRRQLPRFQITEPTDAIDLTLRITGHAPDLIQLRVRVQLEQIDRENTRKQNARRNYRARLQLRLQSDPGLMLRGEYALTDEQVDAAIERENQAAAFAARQPQLSQGYDRPRIDQNRLSDQYATVSNFYAALGSPNMMPMTDAQVRANPYVAANQLQFGLDNPALTVLLVATPMGEGSGAFQAGKTAFRQGMQTAGNWGTRAYQATAQGARAAGKTLYENAPRVAANTFVMTTPIAASAASFGDEDPNNPNQSNGGGSAMPWIIGGGATILGGRWVYNKWKGRGLTPTAVNPTAPRYFTWWERNPVNAAADLRHSSIVQRYNAAVQAGDKTAIDALKVELSGEPAQITTGTGKKAKTVANPEYWSDEQLTEAITNRTYKSVGLPLIYTPSQNFWRGARNTGRFVGYSTALGYLGQGLFGGGGENQPSSLPTADQYGQGYQDVDDSIEQQEAVPDTIVAIPRDSVPPAASAPRTIIWSNLQ